MGSQLLGLPLLGSHAHPLLSFFFSHVISLAYLSERHTASELLGHWRSWDEFLVSWSLDLVGLRVLGLARPPARLVLRLARLARLARRHLARRHLVVSCLRTIPTSTYNTSREVSPQQRACTSARRARRERSGKHAARVHATASRATPCRQAANTRLSKQRRANVHVHMCVQYEYHERDLQALSVRIERVVQERTRVRSAV